MSGVVEKADLFFSCIAVEIRKCFSFLFLFFKFRVQVMTNALKQLTQMWRQLGWAGADLPPPPSDVAPGRGRI